MSPAWVAPRHPAEPMGWRDVTWWRMDEPCNRMVIHWVAWLDGAPALARLDHLVRARLLQYPRFAQCVTRRGWRHHWTTVATLDPGYHLQERVLEGPVDEAAVQACLAERVPQGLDPQRPLWQWLLLRSAHGGRAALLVCHHHCLTDGDGLVHMLRHLSDDQPAPPVEPALSDPVRGTCRLVPPPATPGRRLGRWLGMAAQALRLGLLRPDTRLHFKGLPGPGKVLLSTPALPLSTMKAVACGLGVTVNDVWLGLVAGALRRYSQRQGWPTDHTRLRAAVTYNLRHRDDAALMGNHFTLTALSLPTHLGDPVQRLHAVRQGMDAIKRSLQPQATCALMTLMGMMPVALQRLSLGLFTGKGTLVSTNLRGPEDTRHLAGRRMQAFHCWVPQTGRTGVGLMLSTYAGQAVMSLACDAGVVAQPDHLAQALTLEWQELCRQAAVV